MVDGRLLQGCCVQNQGGFLGGVLSRPTPLYGTKTSWLWRVSKISSCGNCARLSDFLAIEGLPSSFVIACTGDSSQVVSKEQREERAAEMAAESEKPAAAEPAEAAAAV